MSKVILSPIGKEVKIYDEIKPLVIEHKLVNNNVNNSTSQTSNIPKIRIIKNTKSRHMYKIRKVITYTTFLKEVIDGFIGPIGCMMSFAGGSSLSQPMVGGGGFLFLRSVVHLW